MSDQLANGVDSTSGRDHVALMMASASPVAATPCLQLLADVNGSVSGLQGPKFFEAWSRPQLQQLLNMKTGSTGRYATYSKSKLIQRLTQLQAGPKVSQLVSMRLQQNRSPPQPASAPPARKRKNPFPTSLEKVARPRLCGNVACNNGLEVEGEYCKRCSCYFCNKLNDDKDSPDLCMKCPRDNCGAMSHMECALKSKAAGVVKRDSVQQLDGSYVCQECGWITNLLGFWEKVVRTAKDADRVDVLASRISFALRLLDGTIRYQQLHGMVVEAAKRLEKDVGSINSGQSIFSNLQVTALPCGAPVRNLLEGALHKATFANKSEKQAVYVTVGGPLKRAYTVRFEDITPVSLTITWSGTEAVLGDEITSHKIWCRAVEGGAELTVPVHTISGGGRKASFAGLHPGIDYAFTIVPFTRSGQEAGQVEARCSTCPRTQQDWQAILQLNKRVEGGELETIKLRQIGRSSTLAFNSNEPAAKGPGTNGRIDENITTEKRKGNEGRTGEVNAEPWKMVPVVHGPSTSGEAMEDAPPSRGDKADIAEEENIEESWSPAELEENFLFSVKVVVWLEKVGLLKTKFRLKLLTWLGVRATSEELKTFCVLVKTLMTDPNALAVQLIDFFQEILSLKQRKNGN